MQDFINITKALSDEARVRTLVALGPGELCVCQIVQLLGLAPSTVSRHLELLHQAGLTRRRKQGRWHYYRLAGTDAPPMVRQALAWVADSVAREALILADTDRLCCIRDQEPQEMTECYRTRATG